MTFRFARSGATNGGCSQPNFQKVDVNVPFFGTNSVIGVVLKLSLSTNRYSFFDCFQLLRTSSDN